MKNSYIYENLEWNYTELLLCFSLNKFMKRKEGKKGVEVYRQIADTKWN